VTAQLDAQPPQLAVTPSDSARKHGRLKVVIGGEAGARVTVTAKRAPALDGTFTLDGEDRTRATSVDAGRYVVVVTAKDAVGNATSTTITVKVL
jgi:hypothetical protein